MKWRAIFLDRDGVLNKKRDDYVKKPEELEILPDVHDNLRALKQLGFRLIVITNQSAINRGLITHRDLAEIHTKLLLELGDKGCKIDAIYYCPHRPDERCECRKPSIKLLLDAAKDHNIDLKQSWLIGDTAEDMIAGKRAGCKTVKINTDGSLRSAVAEIVRHIQQENHVPKG